MRIGFLCLLALSAVTANQSSLAAQDNSRAHSVSVQTSNSDSQEVGNFRVGKTRPRTSALSASSRAASSASGLNFATAVPYGSGGRANSVVVADVNGDGKPDLIVANQCPNGSCPFPTDGTVGVLLGNGDGTFQTAVTYSSGASGTISVTVADVNGDGNPDVIVAHVCIDLNCDSSVSVLLGNGNGTFQTAVSYGSGGFEAVSVTVADINGDGKPDLIVANQCFNSSCEGAGSEGLIGILLGNGDGTFQTAKTLDSGGQLATMVTVADVNGDGKPDIVVANACINDCSSDGPVDVLLGNGDGTFQSPLGFPPGDFAMSSATVADVNGDKKLDIITVGGNSFGVLLGKGDGTFQPAVTYNLGNVNGSAIAVADMNGDGKPDLVEINTDNLGVVLGNGDGTFQTAQFFTAAGPGLALGDVNEDGKPDIVTANPGNGTNGLVDVLINTSLTSSATALTSSSNPSSFGNAITFTATATGQPGFFKGTPTGTVSFFDGSTKIGTSNLNGSGVAIFTTSSLSVGTHSITATYNGDTHFASSTSSTVSQVVQGPIVQLSATSFNFGDQTVGTGSTGQTLTLTNTGSAALSISSFQITGANPGSFGKSTSCGTSLSAGSSCKTTLTFHPTAAGTRTATVTITDNASGSPQGVSLTGVGVVPSVTLSPTSLTFPTQVIFSTSTAKTVKLTNSGQGVLHISSVVVTGPFSQTNNCGSTVNPTDSCTLTVKFSPTSIGALSGNIAISDNASGSPEKISLSGTATAIQLSPTSVNFGTQPEGTTSLSKTITLSNKSDAAVSSLSVSITGTNPGDFKQTTTCGSSVASGASCFIKVTFTPAATGARSATVSVSDNGGGSPQKVSLTGTGT